MPRPRIGPGTPRALFFSGIRLSCMRPDVEGSEVMRKPASRALVAWMACAFALPALSMPPPLPPPLVPKPVLLEAHEGAFTLDERTKIFVDSTNPELARTAHYLADRIAEGRGMHLEVV